MGAMTAQDDERWMRAAIELAWRCPPSDTAYSVGAVIVTADGAELSRGFSREDDPLVHAGRLRVDVMTFWCQAGVLRDRGQPVTVDD